MALFSVVFLVVALILIGAGIAAGLVIAAVTAALAALGIASSSLAIAVHQRRARAGVRLFLLQSCILAGIPGGILCAWLVAQFSTLYGLDSRIFIYGGISGAASGLIIALLLDFVLGRAGRAVARIAGARSAAELPQR